ncbi:MAG: GNAT family N-acetyltransferase [Cyanobacteria bacterium REEB67]|nr:GNAT family N-acetyltransferase [Cyanobacteria bacterium REEB67]
MSAFTPAPFAVKPIVLSGTRVRLEPLTQGHAVALYEATRPQAEVVFRWHPKHIDSQAACKAWIDAALLEQASGTSLPFATIEIASGKAIGSSRLFNIDQAHLRAEIGYTWLGVPWQRTGLNRETKYLLMCHAFETWHLRRVEFKTHSLNVQSRTALLKLGASEEGTLRRHMIMSDGSARDSVYFSILDSEWPTVKAKLESGGAAFVHQIDT